MGLRAPLSLPKITPSSSSSWPGRGSARRSDIKLAAGAGMVYKTRQPPVLADRRCNSVVQTERIPMQLIPAHSTRTRPLVLAVCLLFFSALFAAAAPTNDRCEGAEPISGTGPFPVVSLQRILD